jgi:hypothetical protein
VEDRAIVLELVEGPEVVGPLTEEQALPIIAAPTITDTS